MKKRNKYIKLPKYANGGNWNSSSMEKLGNNMGYVPSSMPQNEGEAGYQAGMSGVSKAGPIGGAIGGITSIGDAIGTPIRRKNERMDEWGNLENQGGAERGMLVGSALNPFKSGMSTLSDSNASTGEKLLAFTGLGGLNKKRYANRLEDAEKKRLSDLHLNEFKQMQSNFIPESLSQYGNGSYLPKYGDGTPIDTVQTNTLNYPSDTTKLSMIKPVSLQNVPNPERWEGMSTNDITDRYEEGWLTKQMQEFRKPSGKPGELRLMNLQDNNKYQPTIPDVQQLSSMGYTTQDIQDFILNRNPEALKIFGKDAIYGPETDAQLRTILKSAPKQNVPYYSPVYMQPQEAVKSTINMTPEDQRGNIVLGTYSDESGNKAGKNFTLAEFKEKWANNPHAQKYFPKELYPMLYEDKGIVKRATGGVIRYNGQTHNGPNEGIPVDGKGNPSIVSGNRPVALTENKEVTWLTPEGMSYVFSDKLGFSKKAKNIINKYKLRLGDDLTGNDRLSKESMQRDLESLADMQETVRETKKNKLISQLKELGGEIDMEEDEELEEYKKGGWIQKAINPKHKGYCTPMTKSTCTGHRRALAMTFKKHHGFHKKECGGELPKYEEGMEPLKSKQFEGFDVGDDYGLMYKQPSNQSATQEAPSLYRGDMVSPTIGAAANILANVIAMKDLSKRKPKDLSLGRIRPQKINLSDARQMARENARMSDIETRRNLRESGANPGQYMANIGSVSVLNNKQLNDAIRESYLNEQLQNAQYAQQADSMNAEIAMREAMMNRGQNEKYEDLRRAYRDKAIATVPQYLSDIMKQREYYDMGNLTNEHYNLVNRGKGVGRYFRKPDYRLK